MRLIDADMLKEQIDKQIEIYYTGNGGGIHLAEEVLEWIELMTPTVEAIPIEWVEDWHNKHEWEYESFFRMVNGVPKYAIECMLDDWEKEAYGEVYEKVDGKVYETENACKVISSDWLLTEAQQMLIDREISDKEMKCIKKLIKKWLDKNE